MLENHIQARAVANNMNYQELLLLCYLRKNVFLDRYKALDIYTRHPIFFKTSNDVKGALEGLEIKEFVNNVIWERGVFRVQFNKDMIIDFFSPDIESIVRVKKDKEQVKKKDKLSPEERELVDYYDTFASLPSYTKLTGRRIRALQGAISDIGDIEKIKKAIEFASTSWFVDHTEKPWCDMAWLFDKIKEFMPSGKYNKEKPVLDVNVTEGTVYL